MSDWMMEKMIFFLENDVGAGGGGRAGVRGSGCVAAGRHILMSLERGDWDGHFGANFITIGAQLTKIWSIGV
jgi:hypothetical protein